MSDHPLKKPLKAYLDEFYDDTAKVSDLIRNLGFAGIGIVWIFKNDNPEEGFFPHILLVPLFCIVLGLALDVLQYLWRAIFIGSFYSRNENKYDNGKLTENDIADMKLPKFIGLGSWMFFGGKVLSIFIAYIFIFIFLITKF